MKKAGFFLALLLSSCSQKDSNASPTVSFTGVASLAKAEAEQEIVAISSNDDDSWEDQATDITQRKNTALPSCYQEALSRLGQADPQARKDLSLSAGLDVFADHLACDRPDFDLPHAFHEGVHGASYKLYPLDGGRKFPLARGIRFAPKDILVALEFKNFEKDSNLSLYKNSYLNSNTSSAKDRFYILLDEVNAYSREAILDARLLKQGLPVNDQGARDGVAAMMLFLKLSLAKAAKANPQDWELLRASPKNELLRALWAQSEMALELTCPIEGLGSEDSEILAQVYSRENAQALESTLGRTLARPGSCR